MTREPLPLLAIKALIAAGAACLFMYPLTTPAGFVATALGTIGGYAAARYAANRGLRVPAALAVAFVLGVLAHELGQFLLVHPAGTLARGLNVADATFCATAALALFLAIRTLSQAWRPAAVLELAVVVGAVAHTFAGHRHHRIHEPRFLTDWAWSHGIDPLVVLQGFGIAAVVIAALLLIDVRRTSKLVVSLVFLVLGGGVAFWAMHDIKIELPADTNDIPLGKGSGDVPGAGSGSGSGSAQGSDSGSAHGSAGGSAQGSASGSDQGSSSGSGNGSSSGSGNGSSSGSGNGSSSGSGNGSSSGSGNGSSSGSGNGSSSGSGNGSSSGSGNGSSSGSGSGSGSGAGSGSASGSGGGSGNSGNGQSQKPPDPVAIVVLHDDLPESPTSTTSARPCCRGSPEDRLEEDTTGKYEPTSSGSSRRWGHRSMPRRGRRRSCISACRRVCTSSSITRRRSGSGSRTRYARSTIRIRASSSARTTSTRGC